MICQMWLKDSIHFFVGGKYVSLIIIAPSFIQDFRVSSKTISIIYGVSKLSYLSTFPEKKMVKEKNIEPKYSYNYHKPLVIFYI